MIRAFLGIIGALSLLFVPAIARAADDSEGKAAATLEKLGAKLQLSGPEDKVVVVGVEFVNRRPTPDLWDSLKQLKGLKSLSLGGETERFQAFQLFQGIPQVWCRATIHKLHADHDDLVFGPRELELRTQLLESRRCLAFGVVRGSGDGRYEKKG